MEDVKIKVFFPPNFQNSNLSVNTGEFEFSPNNSNEKFAWWNINRIEKETAAALKGNLVINQQEKISAKNKETGNNSNNTLSCVLIMSCKIEKFSLSGGKVSKVFISKNPKKLNVYKGEKTSTIIKNLEIVF